jgi:hypothetical protein
MPAYLLIMRKIFPCILVLFFAVSGHTQQFNQITFSGASTLSWFSFLTDQGILIRISEEGKVLEWGTELPSERSSNYFAPKLQPYMGRITYYGTEVDSLNRGKIKSVGTCVFTYYGAYEVEEKKGKLKAVGRLNLDYFTHFENLTLKGKLRYIGAVQLDYYAMTDNDAVRGKLKNVGGTAIMYNSTFDDKAIQGKVKSIGAVSYVWATSQDIRYSGSLKSGSYRQNINGITYILR